MKRLSSLFSDTESLIIFGAIVLATVIFASIVNRFLLKKLIDKNKKSNADITSFVFLKNTVLLTIYLVGIGWGLLTLPITKNFAQPTILLSNTGEGAEHYLKGLNKIEDIYLERHMQMADISNIGMISIGAVSLLSFTVKKIANLKFIPIQILVFALMVQD